MSTRHTKNLLRRRLRSDHSSHVMILVVVALLLGLMIFGGVIASSLNVAPVLPQVIRSVPPPRTPTGTPLRTPTSEPFTIVDVVVSRREQPTVCRSKP